MTTVQVEKFNLNTFYEKTPRPLKYILVISLIVVGSYFLFSKKVTNGQIKQLGKIEQTIETTHDLIIRFDEFKTAQYIHNTEVIGYLKNLYALIEELNQNTNRKLELLLQMGGQNTEEILERLNVLNESFERLQKAYTPDELKSNELKPDPIAVPILPKGEVEFIPIDDDGNPVKKE